MLKINSNKLCSFFFPFFLPFYFFPVGLGNIYPFWEMVMDYGRIFIALVIGTVYLLQGHYSKIILTISAYEMVQVLSTIINGGVLRESIVAAGTSITFCMLLDLAIWENPGQTVGQTTRYMALLVLCNLFTVLIFPHGMYKGTHGNNWLLGYDNCHSIYILSALGMAVIFMEARGIHFFIKLIVVLFLSASIYITWSASAVVAVTMWITFWLFSEAVSHYEFLSILRIIGIHTILFFIIIVWRLQKWFAWLIVDILGKNMTFTGRTIIWDTALNRIRMHPILGYGVRSETYMRSWVAGASHCHNSILQILYQTGFVGMAIFLLCFLFLIRPLREEENRRYAFSYLNTMFCILIVGQMEKIANTGVLFMLVMLAYHAGEIEEALTVTDKRTSKFRLVFRRNT